MCAVPGRRRQVGRYLKAKEDVVPDGTPQVLREGKRSSNQNRK